MRRNDKKNRRGAVEQELEMDPEYTHPPARTNSRNDRRKGVGVEMEYSGGTGESKSEHRGGYGGRAAEVPPVKGEMPRAGGGLPPGKVPHRDTPPSDAELHAECGYGYDCVVVFKSPKLKEGDTIEVPNPRYLVGSASEDEKEFIKYEVTSFDDDKRVIAKPKISTFDYGRNRPILTKVLNRNDIKRTHNETVLLTWVNAMKHTGLETMCFFDETEDFIYCKVHAPVKTLNSFADLFDVKVPLNEDIAKERLRAGNPAKEIKPYELPHDPERCKFKPFQHVHLKYDCKDELQELYKNNRGMNHPWTASRRIYLITEMIKSENGANLELSKALDDEDIVAYMPLHDKSRRDELRELWFSKFQFFWLYTGGCCSCLDRCFDGAKHDARLHLNESSHVEHYEPSRFIGAPVSKHWPIVPLIHSYFGAKVTLYFAFLVHYTSWLVVPAIIGIPCFVDGLVENTNQPYSSAAFALIVVFWAFRMVSQWPKTEARLALSFGTLNCEENEIDRADFDHDRRTQTKPSLITGEDEKYYPSELRTKSQSRNTCTTISMLICVVAAIGAIFGLRYYLQNANDTWGPKYGAYIGSVANAIQIQVFNEFYNGLANAMTRDENYRTETEFQDALISKRFAFTFINSFASFYYIAFIQQWLGGCDGTDGTDDLSESSEACMQGLNINIMVIFGQSLIVGNMNQVLIPWIQTELAKRQLRAQALASHQTEEELRESLNASLLEDEQGSDELSEVSKQLLLDEYDGLDSIGDYTDVIIQFGFVTLFVVAFPLAPLAAYFSNLLEIRADGFKLLDLSRRTIPVDAEDIGAWQAIMYIIIVVAVWTNTGIICFTENVLEEANEKVADDDSTPSYYLFAMGAFVVSQWIVFLSIYMYAGDAGEWPEDVKIQAAREEFIQGKLIEFAADDEPGTDVDDYASGNMPTVYRSEIV